MRKKLLVIGEVAAGPKAAAKARRCDPEMEITIYQEEDEISYAGCGLPYHISGLIDKRKELISRTQDEFAQDEIDVHKHCRVEKIDIEKHTVSVKNLQSGEICSDRFDRLVLATGAQPIRPKIKGIDLNSVFYLRSIFDADEIIKYIMP